MRRFILGVMVVLLLAGSVGAEISAGPTGPFVVVDSEGAVVGGMVPAHRGSNVSLPLPPLAVALETSEGTGIVWMEVQDSSGIFAFSTGETVLFSGADCTGDTYSDPSGFLGTPPLLAGIDGGPRLVVGGTRVVYAATGPEASIYTRPMSALSVEPETGEASCVGYGAWLDATPVIEVGDLDENFSPPFRIASMDDPEWIPAGIPLPEWFGLLVVGFLFGVFYMKGKYDGRVAQAG